MPLVESLRPFLTLKITRKIIGENKTSAIPCHGYHCLLHTKMRYTETDKEEKKKREREKDDCER